jgi:TPR repeat protein
MDFMVRAAGVALIPLIGFAGCLVAGPFEDGVDAARRADYAAVIRLWRPLAEQGDARAQTNLALMYDNGRGVLQDYAAAMSWYRKAAEQGDAAAQTGLGVMYANGHGVPRDYVSAHMWFALAAANGDQVAKGYRDRIAARMTPEQIAEAERLAHEFTPKASSGR